jgi:hypothetical protein
MALACGNSRQAASSRPVRARVLLTRRIPLDLFPRLLVLGLRAKPAVTIPQQVRRVLALPLIISVPVSQIIQLWLRGALKLTLCCSIHEVFCWSQGSAMPPSAPPGQQDGLNTWPHHFLSGLYGSDSHGPTPCVSCQHANLKPGGTTSSCFLASCACASCTACKTAQGECTNRRRYLRLGSVLARRTSH